MRGLPIVIVLALTLGASVGSAVEQTVTPIEPRVEQRVVPVGPAETQRVVPLSSGATEDVTAAEPPSPAGKAASTAGKVAFGFTAAVISLASMAATIMFI